ncbi:hypothetical protein GCM10025868_41150 [Angustibacter aerolatus]|uniref:HMA domain-containing protein n=1 Tax=Angustibacter aerolatus TaxID=1162965 RepID=A0ABQ6JNN0_9ACTN|nr:hypothetical protein [Angustibacter aerolatus]GMA88865.1 hypothetical protein GCM10025868_41150 [Angustibacter aerolatus]
MNLATERARVSYADDLTPADLVQVVEDAGYRATLPSAGGDDEAAAELDARLLRRRLLVSAALSLPVVLLAMVPTLQVTGWQWASLVLATPVVAWGGLPFHRAAWLNLRHRTATMDTLVSVGTLAAYAWSVVALTLGTAGEPRHAAPLRA